VNCRRIGRCFRGIQTIQSERRVAPKSRFFTAYLQLLYTPQHCSVFYQFPDRNQDAIKRARHRICGALQSNLANTVPPGVAGGDHVTTNSIIDWRDRAYRNASRIERQHRRASRRSKRGCKRGRNRE
jgi:hypothetical protein